MIQQQVTSNSGWLVDVAGRQTKEKKAGRARRVGQVMTVILMTGLLLGLAAPVMAQGGGGIGGAIDGIVTAVTDIIQTVCVGLGILGLSIWGIGKIARPVFPQISGLTQNYMGDLMIGIAVVFVASQIVEGLASAMGGA